MSGRRGLRERLPSDHEEQSEGHMKDVGFVFGAKPAVDGEEHENVNWKRTVITRSGKKNE
jgi:hypothetical protein